MFLFEPGVPYPLESLSRLVRLLSERLLSDRLLDESLDESLEEPLDDPLCEPLMPPRLDELSLRPLEPESRSLPTPRPLLEPPSLPRPRSLLDPEPLFELPE